MRGKSSRRRAPVVAVVLAAMLMLDVGAAAAGGPGERSGARGPMADGPIGWASVDGGTTGGAGAEPGSVHVVEDRAQLIAALDNGGQPEAPKVIYVRGDINGHEAENGELLDAQDYAPEWDFQLYMDCFGPEGTEWSDSWYEGCKRQRQVRVQGSNAEKQQIQLEVPSNTTLVGVGRDAQLLGIYLTVRSSENIIVRNLTFEAPVDHFPSWDPWDWGGSWNARFDALSIVTGRNIWIDHCTFTDGRFPNSEAVEGPNGQPVEHHDGLLDIEDGSDLITVSYNQFVDHGKTSGIGSSEEEGDLRITYHHNLFKNTVERSPRVNHAQLHSFNNYLVGSVNDRDYPMVSEELGGDDYFLGMGVGSRMISEYNAFDYFGPGASEDIIVSNRNGHRFLDRGSWFLGRRVDVNALAERKFEAASATAIAEAEQQGVAPPEWALEEFSTDVGWSPVGSYAYHPQRSAWAVRATVLLFAGAGKLRITAP